LNKKSANKPRIVLIFAGALMLIALAMVVFFSRPGEVVEQGVSRSDLQQDVQQLKLPALSDADYDWIAARIYQNEAMGQSKYLTYWGEGEDFPSFGIGHFIWFPAGVDAPFDEMFPDMVHFVRQRSADKLALPVWMRELEPFDSPWTDKQQFDQAWSSIEMSQLRDWLEATGQFQARFIVATFEQRWRDFDLPAEQKQGLTAMLQRVADSAGGLFAIVDYYNFKGLGINPRERYQQQGWGLIQVLETLAGLEQEAADCVSLVELFRQAATSRLSMRVELSPPERNESRWLAGWLTRLQGYVDRQANTGHFRGAGFRILPYLQNPHKNSITLSWLSNDDNSGQVAIWQAEGGNREQGRKFESDPRQVNTLAYHPEENLRDAGCPNPAPPFLHELRIDGLETGTAYQYEVSQDQDQAQGGFTTAVDQQSALRFIVYGDSETEPESTGKHANWPGVDSMSSTRKYPVDQTTGYAQNLKVIQQRQPDFVAIAGDLVESGGEQRDWDEFWIQNSSLAASTYILPALGNHEYFGGPGVFGKYGAQGSERAVNKYKTYFDLPSNHSGNEDLVERYYSLDYGPITLIVLDTTDGQPHRSDDDTNWYLLGEGDGGVAPDWHPGSEQYNWLQKELNRAQRESQFTFVMFHGAPWSSGVHALPPGEGSGRDVLSAQPVQLLTSLFSETGVDAVFNGHDEMYEHSVVPGFEMKPDGARIEHDIHFYDIGIGGDGLRGPVSDASNPHQVFLAHYDAAEVYAENGVLTDGGKHYGHLEINIEKQPDGQWQAHIDAVHIFPLINTGGLVTGFERRLYDDSVNLSAKKME
jgi:hypothetical protein